MTEHNWQRKREWNSPHLGETTSVEHCSKCDGKRSVLSTAAGHTILFSHPPTLTDVCQPPSLLAAVVADHKAHHRPAKAS